MRQSKPREIVSVGKRNSEVAVVASKMTAIGTCYWAIEAIIIGPSMLASLGQLFMSEKSD